MKKMISLLLALVLGKENQSGKICYYIARFKYRRFGCI